MNKHCVFVWEAESMAQNTSTGYLSCSLSPDGMCGAEAQWLTGHDWEKHYTLWKHDKQAVLENERWGVQA